MQAVVQRPGRDVAARQFGQLLFHFADHLFGKTARRRQQNRLRVASVLGLRQQIGSHESGHGARIGHYQHFGRPAGMSIATVEVLTCCLATVTYWLPGPKILSVFGMLSVP